MANEKHDKSGDSDGFLKRWSARKRRENEEVSSPSTVVKEEVGTSPIITESNDLEPSAINPLVADSDSDSDSDSHSHSNSHSNSNSNSNSNSRPDAKTESQLNERSDVATEPAADELGDDEEPLLTDKDMPPVPDLTAESDLSVFFNRGVSAALRKQALRHVFSLPVYNERDGLNDYDDDFTKFEPLGDTVTSDMKWHKARKEREAEEAAAREEEARRLAEEEAQQSNDQRTEQIEDEHDHQSIDEQADENESITDDDKQRLKSGADSETETETDTDGDGDSKTIAESNNEAKAKAKAKAKADADADADAGADADSDSDSDSDSDAGTNDSGSAISPTDDNQENTPGDVKANVHAANLSAPPQNDAETPDTRSKFETIV